MDDVYEKSKRSEIMSAVRSKGNKSTELKLIEIFKANGIKGWKRGYPVKGHPDFVFLDKKIAIFVDGCFWHGHTCKHIPRSNEEFWIKKIESNKLHDTIVTEKFISRGWRVVRIWECELRGAAKVDTISTIISITSSPAKNVF
ncbi:MAG: very short patch repair endonuclease [Christensenella sp.]|nr:very short patch repair endonuclease [Christensenella sp.]